MDERDEYLSYGEMDSKSEDFMSKSGGVQAEVYSNEDVEMTGGEFRDKRRSSGKKRRSTRPRKKTVDVELG